MALPRHLPSTSESHSFWKELRERRVVRVGLAYLAVGWGAVEVSDTLADILELPGAVPRVVLVLVVLGAPLALGLAWAFQWTSHGIRRAPRPASVRSSRMAFASGLCLGVLAVTSLAFVFVRGNSGEIPGGDLDQGSVAVLPFRVSAPPELSYLGGGMMDLLAARLDGEVGPRSVDPGFVSSVVARSSADPATVATAVGAGRFITGSVVGNATRILVNAEFTRVGDGFLEASASAEGHPDSLTVVADQVIGQLLSLSAGEYPESVALLTSTSPDALRAYLQGREAWRAAQYFDAVALFDEALAIDSTFALAAIARADGGNMATGAGSGSGLNRAWQYRDRLGRRDLLYLQARRPEEPRTRRESIEAYEDLTRELPDRVEAWYWLGESQMHSRVGYDESWVERMRMPFERALELDPAYLPALDHLVMLEAGYGTTDELLNTLQRYGGLSAGDAEATMFDIFSQDGLLRLDIESLETTDDPNQLQLAPLQPIYFADRAPEGFLPFIEAGLAALERRAGFDVSRTAALTISSRVRIALGQPSSVSEVVDQAIELFGEATDEFVIEIGSWEGMMIEDATAAAARLEERLPEGPLDWVDQTDELVTLEAWRYLGDPAYVGREAASAIREVGVSASYPIDLVIEAHALLLEAWVEVREGDGDRASELLDRLTEIVREGPGGGVSTRPFLMAMSTIYEELGRPRQALDILDWRSFLSTDWAPLEVAIWRRQGRLAEEVGDTARAIGEYRNYVKFRQYAELSLLPEVESVRSDLDRLTGN